MKRFLFLPVYAVCSLALVMPGFAANIDRAKITEAVNSVNIIDLATKAKSPARVQQELVSPNILRTGGDSRAELIAADQTVTRVGSNTLFSFVPNSREIDLEKGSLLFTSPSGKGGGTIRTPAASAAVLGTTMIVSASPNGGLKVLLLEGKGRVTLVNGKTYFLRSGQMLVVEPRTKIGQEANFRIRDQVRNSNLIRGFKRPLPSAGKIAAAIAEQEKEISDGRLDIGTSDVGPQTSGANIHHREPTTEAPPKDPSPKRDGSKPPAPKPPAPPAPKPPTPATRPPSSGNTKPPSVKISPNGF